VRRRLHWLVEHRRPLFAVVLTTAAGITLLIVLLGGPDDDDELGGRAKEIVAVMDDFERSARAGDFNRICNDLFTLEAREAAGGRECPSLLAQSAEGVNEIEVELESIVVKGDAARARVKASADDVPAATDTVRFVRRDGRFRIASLSP
jgi:hypothetical protein